MSVAAETEARQVKAGGTHKARVSSQPVRETIAPPPKLRRRPLLVAASVAAVCLGALLAVWAYTSTSTAREVVGGPVERAPR